MKELLKKITPKFIFQNMEEIVASLLFVVTLVLVIINVLTRYVFRTGIPWAEEMATSCFVWTAFMCSYLFYISIIYLMRSYRKPTAILGVSSAWISSSLCLSFFDMAIWSFIFIVQDWRSIKKYGRVLGVDEEVSA